MSLLYNDATLTNLGKVAFFSGFFFLCDLLLFSPFWYSNVKVGVNLLRILDEKIIYEISKHDLRKSSLKLVNTFSESRR